MNSFTLFCFKCKKAGLSVSMKCHGTMVTVIQHCMKCNDVFEWKSQPLLMGKYPAGNVLLSFAALICIMANEVLTKLTEDAAQSKFFSIMFHATTDSSLTEQEAVFVLYFDPTPAEPQLSGDSEPMVTVKMGFLSIENLRSSDAQGVLAGIKRSLENLELRQQEGTPPTPVGLGGDNCSTNRGAISGVPALFKKEFPWFSFSWCVAHRLELALKDALSTTYFK